MIHLYAEHLLNIRTLSIQAVLSTVSSKETKATLSADGKTLTLTHQGESASIKLPINLSPNKQSNITLTIPAVPSRQLSFRVNLEEKEGVANGCFRNGDVDDANVIPWTADQLTTETEVCCRSCGSVLVKRGKIQSWKDLPSEGWAEMMDFWHCHKPHEPHDHDSHSEVKKGYAADSQLALESGVGIVDPMDFLFVAEDCKNVTVGTDFPFRSCSIFPHTLTSALSWGQFKRTGTLAPEGNVHGSSRDTMNPRLNSTHVKARISLAQAVVGRTEAWSHV